MQLKEFEVEFGTQAQMIDPAQEAAINAYLTSAPGNETTDVVVISHGWNNDMAEARELYKNFFQHLSAVIPDNAVKVAAIEVLWPSKKFTDAELIPGGAASAGNDRLQEKILRERVDDLAALFPDSDESAAIKELKALVPNIEDDEKSQREFVRKLGELVARHVGEGTPEDGQMPLLKKDGADLLALLKLPVTLSAKVGEGGGGAGLGVEGNQALAGGGAAGFSDFINSVKGGAMRLLNFTTYYAMKERAGLVGDQGVNAMLHRIQQFAPKAARFHLVGHSFGGRLVTAAVSGPNKLNVSTLLLLQAAFSHNGFATKFDGKKDGFFRKVVAEKRVSGPILITHSLKDTAVGIAYPLASRINRENAASFGGPDDEFGGIGRNGAQRMTDADTKKLNLLKVGQNYDLSGGFLVFNLNGDSIIESHGDVARAETAHVLAQAMRLAKSQGV